MLNRGILTALALVCLSGVAAAKGKKEKGHPGASRVCTGSGKAKKCKSIKGPIVVNWHPAAADLRSAPVPRPSGHIQIEVSASGQKLDLNIYNADGSYDQKSLAALDDLWACHKTHEIRAVDPRLYEVLSTIYDHYQKPVILLSGFRYQRNEGSRHFHASAMDIRVTGTGWKDLYEFANSLDGGGMGIGQYPTMDFVHVDFRAPGEPSTRWIDKGVVNKKDPGKMPSKAWHAHKGNS